MTPTALRSPRLIPFALIVGLCVPALAAATEHSLDGVNFTGPLITPNPAGMPKGHAYVEPYLIRIDSDRYFDGEGRRHDSAARSSAWLTVVPIAYGLGQRVTAQVNLSAARAETGAERSRGFRAGDTTAMVQYLLQAPNEDGSRPAVSVSLSQRYATGSYDRIGGNPLNAQGDGVQRTTFGLGVQQVLWLPNGRPLRWRGQLSASPAPARVALNDSSVYGTPDGFRGNIAPGSLLGISLAGEYSFNSRWVGVFEVAASRQSDRHISGYAPAEDGSAQRIDLRLPGSRNLTLAPAVQYHFSPNVGLIAGVEFTVAGRNTGSYINPQVALGMFF
jgi:hypothetical protein